jgi:hypothetical protein
MSGSPSRALRPPLLSCRAAPVPAAAGAPETTALAVTDARSLRKLLAVVLLALAPAGRTQTGDLGRPRPSFWNDLILHPAGSLAAQVRGEPVSRYTFTDDEDELRDRAWRFLMPAHERSWFEAIIADLVRTRVLPRGLHPVDRTAYHHALMSGPFRSAASRYRRLSEDAVADLKLIGPFAARAGRVMAADRVRLRSLSHVRDLGEEQAHHAVARVAENRCLIDWVRHETFGRLVAYRYALEHLVIEAPQGEAVATARTLKGLETHRRLLDTLVEPSRPETFCPGTDAMAPHVHLSAAVGSAPHTSETTVGKD